MVNIWIQCFYQISYRENFEKIQNKENLETLPGVEEFLISSVAKQKMISCDISYDITIIQGDNSLVNLYLLKNNQQQLNYQIVILKSQDQNF